MKKITRKPGFEFIFALSIITIFCWPLLVLGQSNKDVKIIIINGDTTINGKRISEMSATDRKEALKDIPGNRNREYRFNFRKRDSLAFRMDTGRRRVMERFFADGHGRIKLDSATHELIIGSKTVRGYDRMPNAGRGFEDRDHMPTMRPRRDDAMPGSDFRREAEGRMRRPESPNSERNTFTHIDKDGIATRINFQVSDASHNHVSMLDLDDLSVVPEFSSGKTVLMFNLPGKVAADVKLADSDGKVLWSDKANSGSFNKTFSMPLNGIYYLTVKQGMKTSVKKIVKE